MNLSNKDLTLLAVALAVYFFFTWEPTAKPPPPKEPAAPVVPAKRIKLYLFTSDGCAPCLALKKALKDPRVVKALERFDLEETRDPDLVRSYHITGYPALVVADTTGDAARLVGSKTPEKLVSWLEGIR